MLKDKIIFKVYVIAMLITLLGIIVFSTLIPVNYYLLLGWIYGCCVATFGYLINVLLITIFLKSVKTKSKGFILGFIRSFLQMVYHASFLVILISVNTKWKNNAVFELNKLEDLLNPINFFTYLGGAGIFTISSLVVNIPLFNKKKER